MYNFPHGEEELEGIKESAKLNAALFNYIKTIIHSKSTPMTR